MKVYNPQTERQSFTKILNEVRNFRSFDIQKYLDAKSLVINEYFLKNKLDTAVVAVSGGIDSACVLAIMAYAQKQQGSSIKHIVAITLPLIDRIGATNQSESIEKATILCKSQGIKLNIMEIGQTFDLITNQVNKRVSEKNETDAWALGQLTAYTRTPYLYYTTSVLSSEGKRSIIVGTTNRDEGAYLGYVGKASDAMVDIQIISDLHKSEVYSVSKKLGVPEMILEATPSGDMYDNRNDEEVFGASYDFVEIYINYLNMSKSTQNYLLSLMTDTEKSSFEKMKENIEALHNYNRHKYLSGSQAIHLDVMKSSTKGGWIDMVHSTPHKTDLEELNKPIFSHNFSGFVSESPVLNLDWGVQTTQENIIISDKKEVNLIKGLIDSKSVAAISDWFDTYSSETQKTDQYGKKSNQSQAIIGSNRLSFYSEELAKMLFEKISFQTNIDKLIVKDESSTEHFTNFGESKLFRLVGINPMFRVIEYGEGDFLVPHYDDSWVKNKYQRSLKTLIIGLDNSECLGGETQFLKDHQDNIPYEMRDFSDKDSISSEIAQSFKLESGQALVFDHRILHQGNMIYKNKKRIIRTELIYESCDPLRD